MENDADQPPCWVLAFQRRADGVEFGGRGWRVSPLSLAQRMKSAIHAILALVLALTSYGEDQSVTTLVLRREVQAGEKLEADMVHKAPFTLSSDVKLPIAIEDIAKNWILEPALNDYLGKPFVRDARELQMLHVGMFKEGKYPELDIVPAGADEELRTLSKEFTKPIAFRFVDETGEPIDGTFTLHHTKDGRYVDNWHRYKPLNEQGEITIDEFPPEFEFGGSSNDEFYHYWIRSADLDPAQGRYLHRCSPSGAMKFEITSFPEEHYDSLVVRYWRHRADGSHERVKGIGIFPDDPEHSIGGLDPGTYHIEIKFNYEDKKPIFTSEPFTIKLKEYTTLPKIEITENAIEESRR